MSEPPIKDQSDSPTVFVLPGLGFLLPLWTDWRSTRALLAILVWPATTKVQTQDWPWFHVFLGRFSAPNSCLMNLQEPFLACSIWPTSFMTTLRRGSWQTPTVEVRCSSASWRLLDSSPMLPWHDSRCTFTSVWRRVAARHLSKDLPIPPPVGGAIVERF